MTLEVNAAIALGDEQQRRLVFVREILDELQALKKRVVTLENERDARRNQVTKDDFENGPALAPMRPGHRLVRTEDADTDDVFSESLDTEDLVTVRPAYVEAELFDAAAASRDDDVSVHV